MTVSEKKKRTWWKILCIILAAIAGLVLLVLLGARAYFRLSVSDYYRASEKGFEIPGLGDGFIPQGLEYDETTDQFFVTGYMGDGSASPIYLVSRTSGALMKTVLLAQADGTDYTGHAGGLAVHGDYVYVAGGADYCFYVYSYGEILEAADGASVRCLGEVSTGSKQDGVRVSAVTVEGNRIYAVEFYRDPNYTTPDSHKLETTNGDYHQAIAVAYAFSEEGTFGIDPVPISVYSLPDCVQGMCFRDGKIYLSTSYGASFSHIYEYEAGKAAYQKDMTICGATVPVYALDSGALTKDRKIAPMSEEIVFVDGKLYVMCESASNQYIFGKLTSAKWCYATDVDAMD